MTKAFCPGEIMLAEHSEPNLSPHSIQFSCFNKEGGKAQPPELWGPAARERSGWQKGKGSHTTEKTDARLTALKTRP